MADRKGPNAKLTGVIQMAAPALTRKELLDRLRIEFPDAGYDVGIMRSKSSGAAAAACVSATTSVPCGQVARFQAPQ